MYDWDRTRQDNKFKQKLQNIKSTLPKISQNSNYQQNKHKINSSNPTSEIRNKYRKQNYVKLLLKEFGLGQYLRKLFELGYDDTNISKIGGLNQKEFNELLDNLKIFPGHQVKMENFYEYLRQLNKCSNLGKQNASLGYNNKRFASTTTNSNQNRIQSSRVINTKSINPTGNHSINNSRHSNQLVNSFLNGDFGYSYYLNDSKYNHQSLNYNDIKKDESKKIQSARLDKYNSHEYIKMIKDDQIEEMNEDIDKMLKYYMKQLNEKLDDSYESIEESSLSNLNITNGNIQEEENKKNLEELSALKGRNKSGSNSKFNNSKEEIVLPKTNKSNTNSNTNVSNSTSANVNPPISNKKIPIKLPSIQKNKSNTSDNKNSIELNKDNSDISKKKFKEDIEIKEEKNEEKEKIKESKDKKVINANEEEQDDYNKEQFDYVAEEEIPKEEDIQEEKKEENDVIVESLKKEEDKEKEKYNIKETVKDDLVNKEENNNNNNKQYSKEQEMFDNLRLTKSSDGDYIRQNMDTFDVEYMCRCLALALMKHIESGKDKSHITELIDVKEEFSFFNSIYNSKMDFIFNFFKKDAKPQELSNLDRLDLEEHEKNKKETISFVNHFKQKKDEDLIKETEAKDKLNKIHTNFTDIEKDIKFIDEFFSGSKKRSKNYQGLTDKTKDILNKELSYINEAENENTISKINNSSTNNQQTSPQNNKKEDEYILKKSMQKIIDKEAEEEIENNDNIKNISTDNKDETPINNRFTSLSNNQNSEDEKYKQTPIMKINEELPPEGPQQKEVFESGEMESNYVIDVSTVDKLKSYLLKQVEIFDDDYYYPSLRIQTRKYVPPPDPQQIFEFCANIMFLTKMEKEVMIVTLLYLERLIFNTGLLLTSRNWRRITFTAMIIASKIWDDDSFENNHFAQVFTHLKIGEINLMEKTYLELINYKVYVKCSEYFKYFFIIKSIALKYNFNGMNLIPISVEKMLKIQEYAYQMQKKTRRKFVLNNSAQF